MEKKYTKYLRLNSVNRCLIFMARPLANHFSRQQKTLTTTVIGSDNQFCLPTGKILLDVQMWTWDEEEKSICLTSATIRVYSFLQQKILTNKRKLTNKIKHEYYFWILLYYYEHFIIIYMNTIMNTKVECYSYKRQPFISLNDSYAVVRIIASFLGWQQSWSLSFLVKIPISSSYNFIPRLFWLSLH